MQNQDTPKPPADSDQTPDRVGVGRCDLLAVDSKIDLCLRMMVYAAFDDRHGDLRPSQVRDNLCVFFPQETIQAAENLLKEGWIPPSVDLSFYSANA
jgi:hypothetical protein